MVERFNLYDVYGYLLPGLTLLGLLWLPYGFVLGVWPPLELGSALFALVAGYITGHLLHELSRWVFPSHSIKNGVRSLPSDEMLEADDKTFSPDIKQKIREKIHKWYNIEAGVRENRQAAFNLCRNELLQKGRASYAEQFQGLYALMRGVSGACFLAAASFFGWVTGSLLPQSFSVACIVFILLLLAVVFALVCLKVEIGGEMKKAKSNWPRYRYVTLGAVLLVGGATVAFRDQAKIPEGVWLPLLLIVFLLVGVGIVCIGTYKSFALNFARTVYNDFLALERKLAPDSTGGQDGAPASGQTGAG